MNTSTCCERLHALTKLVTGAYHDGCGHPETCDCRENFILENNLYEELGSHTPTPVKEECSHIFGVVAGKVYCRKCGIEISASPTEEECTCTTYKLGDSSTFKVTLGECKIHGAVSHAKPPHTQEEWQIRLEELAIKGCRKEELEAFIRKVRDEGYKEGMKDGYDGLVDSAQASYESGRNDTLDEVEKIIESRKKTERDWAGNYIGDPVYEEAQGYNQALDDLLHRISDLRK